MGRGITAKVGLIATSVAIVAASIAVPVATSGTAGAATGGTWTIDPQPAPVRAIHVALMHTGKVLLAAGSGNDKAAFAAKSFATSVWDPVTNTYHAVSTPWDAFCAGHAFLPDGRILVTGGTQGYPRPVTDDQFAGSKKAYVFDPKTETYVAQENMNTARWYPSVTELGDGRLFTVGGLNSSGVRSNKNQIFDGFKWSQNADPPPQLSFMPMYPSMHLLRDGRLFYSGVNVFGAGTSQPGIWNIQTNAFQPVPGLTDPDRRDQGQSVLLPPAQDQKVLVIGGGSQNNPVFATSTTAIVDLSKPNPTYTPGPDLDTIKMYVSAVILPDSTVMETGGALASVKRGNTPVASTQIFDPKTSTWSAVNDPSVPRTYHSSALLLPDARVATFGGNPIDEFELRVETFTPPYLETGTPRPVLGAGPTEVRYGAPVSVATTQSFPIKSAVLITPGAVTHSTDNNQRLIKLDFTTTPSGISFKAPSEPNLAPPGWYMLFAVDENGVPSVAKWVHLTNGSSVPVPNVPGGYVTDGFGGVHPFALDHEPLPFPAHGTPAFKSDIARGAALRPTRHTGYELDGFGGIHPFGVGPWSAPVRTKGGPAWTFDIARNIALMPNNQGGYVLDGLGGIHPFSIGDGPKPPAVHDAPYWPTQDIARGIAILPDSSGGYVVDGLGGIQPFRIGSGPLPPAVHSPYHPRKPNVRGIALMRDGSGGYVLDGSGRFHPFKIGANTPPPVTDGPLWPGGDVARGATL